jgi:hypothetical protein
MVSSSIFVAFLGLVACVVAQQQQQPECASEFQDFHSCMRTNSKPPPTPDFSVLKPELDACFTQSGCTPPSGPPSQGGQQGPGGRAGPPPGGNNGPFQCFQAVHSKVGDQMTKCLQDKGVSAPSFGPGGGGPPPGFGGQGGPPPGGPPFGGPGGPGGPGGFGGPPPGGPGGPFGGGPPPGGDGPPIEMLASLCNNDQDKAKQLQSCMKGVQEKHKPTRDQVKDQYDSMCAAEKTCKPKLGSCDDKMHKQGQAMCECHEQVRPQAEAAMQAEDSCKNVKMPSFLADKQDCSKPPSSPCDDGFDKFYDRVSKGGGPPFGH